MAFIFILVIIQGTGAGEQLKLLSPFHLRQDDLGVILQSGCCSYLTGMALGTALMLLCWCLGRCSIVRVNVSKPLSWSVFCGCGGICGFNGLELRPC